MLNANIREVQIASISEKYRLLLPIGLDRILAPIELKAGFQVVDVQKYCKDHKLET